MFDPSILIPIGLTIVFVSVNIVLINRREKRQMAEYARYARLNEELQLKRKKHVHFKKEYTTTELLWEWDRPYASSRLTEIFSKDKLLIPLQLSLLKSSLYNEISNKNYCLFKYPDDDSQNIILDILVPPCYENTNVTFRIDWLLRHFKVLPNIWYDDDGNPYIISGNAAIRELNVY